MEGLSIFDEFILNNKPIRSLAIWKRLLDSLLSYPSQLQDLFNASKLQMRFMANFEQNCAQLLSFIDHTIQYMPPTDQRYRLQHKELSSILIKHLILPLLEVHYENPAHSKLVCSLIHSLIRFSDNINLVLLGKVIGESPPIFTQVVSMNLPLPSLQHWARLMVAGCTEKGGVKSVFTWTRELVEVTSACRGVHGRQEALDRWVAWEAEEMKSGTKDYNAATSILLELAAGMPCRLCYLRASRSSDNDSNAVGGVYPAPTAHSSDLVEKQQPHHEFFDDIEGEGLGIWKISLSERAWRDLERADRSGKLKLVRSKLEDLATGDWIRRSLAKPVSSHGCSFRVKLFVASYEDNGRILWQVDRGYDPRISRDCDSQIVRVWRIGDVKEIYQSYHKIADAQAYWTAQRVESCKKNKVDSIRKVKIPEIFPLDVKEILHTATDVVSLSANDRVYNMEPLDLSLVGRFYTLTNKMFDNIKFKNKNAEFPYDTNSTEMAIVKHNDSAAFILGRSGTGKTTTLMYKLLSRYLASISSSMYGRPIRQVLITRSPQLASKLKEEVANLIRTQLLDHELLIDELNELEKSEKAFQLYDVDYVTQTLPSLQQSEFPLVCTFDHFMAIVMNTLRAFNRQDFKNSKEFNPRDHVNFSIFKAVYWPKLHGTRGLDPVLVFSEIMGVIKGGATFATDYSALTRKDYEELSPNLAPTFTSASDRETVYSLFEEYEQRKTVNGHHDSIDKLQTAMHHFINPEFRKTIDRLVDEIYVDEVQDQRQIEVELLLHLITNPRGIHFAGDSAQCISNDSMFRFSNLKALFYQFYSRNQTENLELAKPKLFALSKNFRSHQGILSLASFVMGILWKAYPKMVDKLAPEIGQFVGPRPMIYVGANIKAALEKAANSDTARKKVILVRDEQIQENLRKILKSNSLVFTILESKGMEYDEVILYEFFSSSPFRTAIRSLAGIESDTMWTQYGVNNPSMCSDFKNLYVAITRPRSKLWILESRPDGYIDLLTSAAVGVPLVEVVNVTSVDVVVKDLRSAEETSAEEWVKIGDQCMDRCLYDQAIRCFQNGGNERKKLWAAAYLAEEQGRQARASGEDALFHNYYRQAERLFRGLGMNDKVAHCLEELGDLVEAGELRASLKQHKHAARLFEAAGDCYIRKAAEQYVFAQAHDEAIDLFHRCNLPQEMIEGLEKYVGRMGLSAMKRLRQRCNDLTRTTEWITTDLKDRALQLFENDEERTQYLIVGKHMKEYVQNRIKKGKLSEAIDYFINQNINLEEMLQYTVGLEEHYTYSTQDQSCFSDIYIACQIARLFQESGKPLRKARKDNLVLLGLSKFWSQSWDEFMERYGGIVTLNSDISQIQQLDEDCQWRIDILASIICLQVSRFLTTISSVKQLSFLLGYIVHVYQIKEWASSDMYALWQCLGVLRISHLEGEPTFRVLKWSKLEPIKPEVSMTQQQVSDLVQAYMKNKMQSIVSSILLDPPVNRSNLFDIECREGSLHDEQAYYSWCVWYGSECQCHDIEMASCLEHVHQRTSLCASMLTTKSNYASSLEDVIDLIKSIIEIKAKEPQLDLHRKTKTIPLFDVAINALIHRLTPLSSLQQSMTTVNSMYRALRTDPTLAEVKNSLLHHLQVQHEQTKNIQQRHQERTSQYIHYYWLRGAIHEVSSAEWLKETQQLRRTIFYYQVGRGILIAYMNMRGLVGTDALPEQFGERLIQAVFEFGEAASDLVHNKQLKSYDANILTVFEDVAAFLLCCCTTTELILPGSWKQLYLTHWYPVIRKVEQNQLFIMNRCLIQIVTSISSVIDQLTKAPAHKNSAHELAVLPRRYLEFVWVIAINFHTLQAEVLEKARVFNALEKVIRVLSQNRRSVWKLKHDDLIEVLVKAFRVYRWKDELIFYEGKSSLQSTSSAQNTFRTRRQSFFESSGLTQRPRPSVQPLLLKPANRKTHAELVGTVLTHERVAYTKAQAIFKKAWCRHQQSRSYRAWKPLWQLYQDRLMKVPGGPQKLQDPKYKKLLCQEGIPYMLDLEDVYDKYLVIYDLVQTASMGDVTDDKMHALYDAINTPWNDLFIEPSEEVLRCNDNTLGTKLRELRKKLWARTLPQLLRVKKNAKRHIENQKEKQAKQKEDTA